MSRKLIVILLASFVFYSAQTLALGLGDIELSSGLNQPFDAKIKLVSRSESELEGLRVGLASNADFERIGAVRLPFLNDLSFEIISPDSGKPYIKVTSQQPIREPFVDFILEANWPAGRLLREYTVLLDPPTVTTERAAPVQAPTTNRRPIAEPAAPRVSAPRRQQEEPATGGGIIQPTTTASAVPTKDLVFGPVGANDTLWNIADSMRPTDDVSVQQMMIALLKENPEAFGDNNINNLKRGSTLSIEDQSVITELSHNQAVAETGRQYQNWLAAKEARRAARGQVAKQDSTEEVVTDSTAESASTDGVVAEGESAPEGGLRLLADDALEDDATEGGVAEADGVSGEIGELREELELTTFAAEAAREQNAELRERLTGLEEQIAAMQRALQLKDDSLTQLQQKLGETDDADGVAAGEESGGASGIETLPLDVEQEADAVAESEEVAVPEMIEPDSVASDAAAVESEPVAEVEPAPVAADDSTQPNMMDNVAKNIDFIGTSIKEKVSGLSESFSMDSIAEALAPENILERYKDNPLIFRIVSGIIAVLVILGLVVRRRRVAAEEQFDEYAAPHIVDEDDDGEDDFDVVADDGDSVEVLNDVDNYVSYQRYDKAEAVLQEAIENSPNRNDFKAKLLEVYYSSKNVPAFVVAADEYYSDLGDDQTLWPQVAKMGAELAPDHHLFSSENVAVAEFDTVEGFDELSELDDVDESDIDVESDDYADIDLEMEVLTADGDVWDESENEAEVVEAAPLVESAEEVAEDAEELYEEASKELEDEFDLDLELDLDGDDEVAEVVSSEAVTDVVAAANDIADEPEGIAEPVVESHDAPALTEALTADVPLEEASTLTLESTDDGVDINAGDNSIEAPSLLERAMDNASTNTDEANFNEKFGSTNVGDSIGEPVATYDADDEGEGYDPSLFAGVDVVSTKLDLAKAYIDMGDQDGARSILGEVVAEGDDEQQSEAQELIDQL